MKSKVAILTSVCEEDKQFFDQYLNEMSRLGLDFFIHFDRCSNETKEKFKTHPNLKAFSQEDNKEREYSEMDKQKAFDLIDDSYDWMMPLDIDETMEKDFLDKVQSLDNVNLKFDVIDCPWFNVWENPKWLRIDGPCETGHRVKFYNLHRKPLSWKYYHPTINGMTLFYPTKENRQPIRRNEFELTKLNIVTLHWGLMTKELREFHKSRWDRIYSSHVGKNPYGFWDWVLDDKIEPKLTENIYL